MALQWEFVQAAPQETVLDLAQALNISPIIAKVMLNRGIDTPEAAHSFFQTEIDRLHDPFLMADMEVAVKILADAIQKKSKILIYGDYDVDGTTSTALLKLALGELGIDSTYHIPDRMKEGYGISETGIDKAKEDGVDLIISIDCGVSAVKEIKYARSLGLDFIVCDHHRPGPELPPANALLNPKRSDCPYPFKELAGVGVGFKLMQALFQHLQHDEQDLFQYLDLVAFGSAADIVPMIDENRIIVKAGVERLNYTKNAGLEALVKVCGIHGGALGTGQIVFTLAPRINAAGRMGDAGRAVDLLTCQDLERAYELAQILDDENRERRCVDEETLNQALELVETACNLEDDGIIVLEKEGWHSGVIGIVASRIVEKYHRPTIMISTNNGVAKGSARSIPGFDIYNALAQCRDLMTDFGGHKYAAGLTMETKKIPSLRESLKQVAGENLDEEMLTSRLLIDGEMDLREIDERFMNFLKVLAPFGPQNMRPVFASRGLQVVGKPRVVGNNHLRFFVMQNDSNKRLDCIGFNLGDLHSRLTEGEVELAYLVEENTWQGRTSTQLRVKDIR